MSTSPVERVAANDDQDAVDFPLLRECPFRPPTGYADLRAESPTRVRLYDGNPAWAVTRYDQIRNALAHSELSSDIRRDGYPVYAPALAAAKQAAAFIRTLVTMDPPEHTALRRMVMGEFTLRRMNGLRPVIRRAADDLIDDMLEMPQPVNLATAFSFPLTGFVICAMLGIPYDEIERFLVSRRTEDKPEDQAEGVKNQLALRELLFSVVDRKRADPGDDVLSRLITKHLETGAIDRDSLVVLTGILIGAGYTPTSAALSVGVVLLLENPEQLAEVRSDPALLPGAVDEVLRYSSVSDLSALRVATADLRIGDTLVRAGDGVLVPNGAANFDPESFPDPDRFDVRRQSRHHLAFGHGIHQCVGANLTRIELEVAYEALFTRVPTLRLAAPRDEIRSRDAAGLPDVYQLPVTW